MTTSRRIIPVRPLIKTSGVRTNETTATAMITRSSNLPVSAAYTMAAWVRIVVDRAGNYRYFFTVENTVPPTDSTANHSMGWYSSDASELYVTGQGGTSFPIHPPRNGLWFYASISSDGSNVSGLWALAGGGFVRAQRTYAALTIASMTFGNNTWDERVGAELAHMRVWKRVLTETELYAEMYSPFAVSRNALDTDILGWNDRSNRGPGGEWTYTAVSGGTQELSLDRPVFMPLRKPETRPARIIPVKALSQYAVSGEGANSTLVAIWPSAKTNSVDALGAWSVSGGVLVSSLGGDTGALDQRIVAPDQYSEIVLGPTESAGVGAGYGICLRAQPYVSATNFYRIIGSASGTKVKAVVNGSSADLVIDAAVTWADRDVLRVEIRGSTISVFKNGRRVYTVVDTSIKFGSPGVAYSSTYSNATSGIRQWRGGALDGALPLPTRTPSGVNWTKHRG